MPFSNLQIEPEVPGLPNPEGNAPSFLRFEASGINLSIINALRRAILADVQTACALFDESGGGHGTVRFIKNTSVLNNEFIGHRLKQVPIAFDENQLFGYERAQAVARRSGSTVAVSSVIPYRFVLRAANTGDSVIDVTTADISVTDASGAAIPKAERDMLFPPSPVSGDHILLARLKPRVGARVGAKGEELHIEFTSELGSGNRRGATFSPVSICFFKNKIDRAAFDRTLADVIDKAKAREGGQQPVDEDALRRQHEALEGQRQYMKDEHGQPSAFEFIVKSETRLRPAYIVLAGFTVLIGKVKRFQRGIVEASASSGVAAFDFDVDADGSDVAPVRITAVPNIDDFYEVAVRGEDHTLGNLVQAMMFGRWVRDGESRDVSFIGYTQPHPQEDIIVFKIKLAKAGDDVRARLVEGLVWLQGHLADLREEWIGFSKLASVRDSRGLPLEAVAAARKTTMAEVVRRL